MTTSTAQKIKQRLEFIKSNSRECRGSICFKDEVLLISELLKIIEMQAEALEDCEGATFLAVEKRNIVHWKPALEALSKTAVMLGVKDE